MTARFSAPIVIVVTCLVAIHAPALAAADAPQSADVSALIRQLGDPDFRKREAATERLKDLGKAGAPALREAMAGSDPEVCARAEALLRQLDRPRIPAGWFGQFNQWVRRESNFAGTRTIEVEQFGRRLSLREGPGGIEMNVTGNDDGREVNVTVRASDLDELRRQDPDAYDLYERVAGARSNLNLRGRRLVIPAVPGPQRPLPMPVPVPIQPRMDIRLLPLAPPEGIPRPPADDLLQLEARVRKQMQAAGVDAVEQQAVLEALRMLRDIQNQGRMALPEDLEAQVKKYNALSDALRQKLEELKLPGPGDALPPPARARLGVSVAPPDPGAADGGVLVTMVIPQSRGEKIGLREGDLIRKVNGKPIEDATALRRTLTDLKDPLVLDVVRSGDELELQEKAIK